MKNMTLEHIAAVCGGTYIGNEADKKREIKGARSQQITAEVGILK